MVKDTTTLSELMDQLNGSPRDKRAAMLLSKHLHVQTSTFVAAALVLGTIDDPVFVADTAFAAYLCAAQEVEVPR